MRRVFWAQAFGLPSAVAGMPAVPVSEGEVLPANLCRVSFGGKDTGGTLMALSLPVAGAEVFWAAQEILGWLSFRFARNPSGDSLGLQRLWLRAAPPRGPQEPWLAVCSCVFCSRECACVRLPVAGGGTLRVFAGSLSEPVPRHAPVRASPAAVQGVARRIPRAPTRTVSGCQASAMFVLHGPSVVCGHHRLSWFSGCSLGPRRWHLFCRLLVDVRTPPEGSSARCTSGCRCPRPRLRQRPWSCLRCGCPSGARSPCTRRAPEPLVEGLGV